jgi:hypothetical protein
VKTRKVGKVEIVNKSPHAHPNGLQATPRGLWVQDQSADNWVRLIHYSDGKTIHEIQPDIRLASGLTVDDENVMWIGSTYNCMHVAWSPETGKTLAKYWAPDAGRIYQKAGDPPASRSSLPPAYPRGRIVERSSSQRRIRSFTAPACTTAICGTATTSDTFVLQTIATAWSY